MSENYGKVVFYNALPLTISGIVKVDTTPVSRLVRVVSVLEGIVIGQTTSDSNGYFAIEGIPLDLDISIIVYDDAGNDVYNDLVLRSLSGEPRTDLEFVFTTPTILPIGTEIDCNFGWNISLYVPEVKLTFAYDDPTVYINVPEILVTTTISCDSAGMGGVSIECPELVLSFECQQRYDYKIVIPVTYLKLECSIEKAKPYIDINDIVEVLPELPLDVLLRSDTPMYGMCIEVEEISLGVDVVTGYIGYSDVVGGISVSSFLTPNSFQTDFLKVRNSMGLSSVLLVSAGIADVGNHLMILQYGTWIDSSLFIMNEVMGTLENKVSGNIQCIKTLIANEDIEQNTCLANSIGLLNNSILSLNEISEGLSSELLLNNKIVNEVLVGHSPVVNSMLAIVNTQTILSSIFDGIVNELILRNTIVNEGVYDTQNITSSISTEQAYQIQTLTISEGLHVSESLLNVISGSASGCNAVVNEISNTSDFQQYQITRLSLNEVSSKTFAWEVK